jgi:hypothetical protein
MEAGGTREVGVSGARLLFAFLALLLSLPCCLWPFLSDEAGAGAEAGRG